jgi:hypothetical protein
MAAIILYLVFSQFTPRSTSLLKSSGVYMFFLYYALSPNKLCSKITQLKEDKLEHLHASVK